MFIPGLMMHIINTHEVNQDLFHFPGTSTMYDEDEDIFYDSLSRPNEEIVATIRGTSKVINKDHFFDAELMSENLYSHFEVQNSSSEGENCSSTSGKNNLIFLSDGAIRIVDKGYQLILLLLWLPLLLKILHSEPSLAIELCTLQTLISHVIGFKVFLMSCLDQYREDSVNLSHEQFTYPATYMILSCVMLTITFVMMKVT